MKTLSSRSLGRPGNDLAPSGGDSAACPEPGVQITLYSRPGCHLCEDMRAAVEAFRAELDFSLREVDIDGDPALADRFGTLVPVLILGSREICHYHLDPAALRRALESAGETS